MNKEHRFFQCDFASTIIIPKYTSEATKNFLAKLQEEGLFIVSRQTKNLKQAESILKDINPELEVECILFLVHYKNYTYES